MRSSFGGLAVGRLWPMGMDSGVIKDEMDRAVRFD